MKALGKLKSEPGIWMIDVPEPVCGHNDVIIKIKKTAICGTDMHIYNWDGWAQRTVPVPLVTGHEFVGEIVEVGSEVIGLKIGDRVSGEGHITCGFCRNCRAGKRHLCPNTEGIGYHRTGCFSEYFGFPAFNVFKLPDEISDQLAAIFDPFGNATHTALSFDLVGEDVLITGAGPVGVMAIAIAKHVGARNIVVTDVNEYRLDLARKMGATLAFNPTQESMTDVMKSLRMNEGFDVGLEMSGNPQAFNQMLEAMRYGGKVALLGLIPSGTGINWDHVIFKSLIIKGIYGREMFDTWYKMVSMLQSGLDISAIITHEFPVDQFEEGFQTMLSAKSGKVLLNWD
ncbi:MAG: L-threonine 3-dehydrogenase [Legionellales bacterium]|nr:L-threonine 3-dehydrogenase [Legionellales bacterium]